MISADLSSALLNFGLAFVPALFGIICHEVAHGYVAYLLGDPTAKSLGRLTLNPIPHIDPMGMGVFAITALTTNFIFGWAKPVPVQAQYFKHPNEGMVFVALAGPMANFAVAILFGIVANFLITLGQLGFASYTLDLLISSAKFGIFINCTLAWFNLLPVPPLDGSYVASALLPAGLARKYLSMGMFGMLLVVGLMFSGIGAKIIFPIIRQSEYFILSLTGVR